jgi:phage anti-repressor protein
MNKNISESASKDNTKLVDARELSKLLGVKEGWIRQNVKIIPHHKLKRLVRFDPQVVLKHFESRVI